MTQTLSQPFKQFRAPTKNSSALVDPSVDVLTSQLGGWQASIVDSKIEFCGKSLEVARADARAEVLKLAVDYTSCYSEGHLSQRVAAANASQPLVLSGHQPELFHPGVWFKNYLIDELAARSGAIGINFLVDNDLCRSTAISVPAFNQISEKPLGQSNANTRSADRPDTAPEGSPFDLERRRRLTALTIPFDRPGATMPWELRRLESQETWDAFPHKVLAALDSTHLPSRAVDGDDYTPLLTELWPLATEAVRQSGRLGQAMAQARHQIELKQGLGNLEVPLSHLVSTRAFARFSIALLSNLPRFQAIYNDCLQQYRSAHKIRNHAHPVPALDQLDGWLEAPLWVYRDAAPTRQRLWVRMVDEQLILSDRAGWQATIEGRLDCDNAATQWLDLLSDGICLRPRALLTTMYLRMFVGDLFVHGIGGAKYDQLTDAIIHEFFDIAPPPVCVATATFRLPHLDGQFPESDVIDDQIAAEKSRLWQLRHDVDQVTEQSAEPSSDSSSLRDQAQKLAQQKADLLAAMPAKGERWHWHQKMKAVTEELNLLVQPHQRRSREKIADLTDLAKQAKFCHSREFSFCLFPNSYLVPRLRSLTQTE